MVGYKELNESVRGGGGNLAKSRDLKSISCVASLNPLYLSSNTDSKNMDYSPAPAHLFH